MLWEGYLKPRPKLHLNNRNVLGKKSDQLQPPRNRFARNGRQLMCQELGRFEPVHKVELSYQNMLTQFIRYFVQGLIFYLLGKRRVRF
jgi:hypothetical protein